MILLKILAFLTPVAVESVFDLEGRFDVNVLRDTLIFSVPCQSTLVLQIPVITEVASLMVHTFVASAKKVLPDFFVKQVFRVARANMENALLEEGTLFACAKKDSREYYARWNCLESVAWRPVKMVLVLK